MSRTCTLGLQLFLSTLLAGPLLAQTQLGAPGAALGTRSTTGWASGTCQPDWIPTYGTTPGFDRTVHDVVEFDDGTGPALYFGGYFETAGPIEAAYVAKWDGHVWSALGLGTNGTVHDLEVFDDGSGPKLYATGLFTEAGGSPASRIACWDGATWSPLGGGLTQGSPFTSGASLAVHDDGSGPALYVGGLFDNAGGLFSKNVARWDGSAWEAMFLGTNASLSAFAVHDDGTGPALYAGGSSTLLEWNGVAWHNSGFGGVSGNVDALISHDDGSGPALFVGGNLSAVSGQPTQRIAKWNGTTWQTWPSGTNNLVRSMAVYDDGSGAKLYLGGDFTVVAGTPAERLAIWDGSTWSAPAVGAEDSIYAMTSVASGSGADLFVVGDFQYTGDLQCKRVARWNAQGWSALGKSFGGQVFALDTFDDGTGESLYAGGFSSFAGGLQVNRIARWSGSDWLPLGTGVDWTVYSLGTFDDGGGPALYVGGGFDVAGGQPAFHIARWKDSTWSALGSGLNSTVHSQVVFDDGSGPALYVGGDFTSAGGSPANRVARWDGSTWSALGAGLTGITGMGARSMAVFDDGSGPALYVGGGFTDAGGVPLSSNLARWDGSSWSGFPAAPNGSVLDMVVHDDGSGNALYVVGSFTSVGIPAAHVARWNGTSWSAVGNGFDDTVWSVAVHDDGSGSALYVGGEFTLADGQPANRVATWDGTSWTALPGGTNGAVYALASFDDSTGRSLHVGGNFNGSPAGDSYLARWGCALPPTGSSYCSAGTTTSGCVPLISGSGQPSASAGSGFTLQASAVEGNTIGLMIYSLGGPASIPWGAGSSLLCVAPPAKRMTGQLTGGAAGTCDGSLSEDWNAFVAGQSELSGATVWAQAWFRDPPAPLGSNFSDGLVFTVAP